MRLASFYHHGRASYGVVTDAGVVDLGARLGDRHPTLRSLLSAGDPVTLAGPFAGETPDLALGAVEWAPVIPDPEKVLCVGVNYHSHRVETGRDEAVYPTLFTRFANTLVGHGGALVRPRASTQLDFEGEMAVIIGRAGRHVPRERALEHVAGYACFNDASVRDWQRHTTQFTPGKNFVSTGSLGPWMVTSDALPDPSALEISLTVNGEEMQRSTTDLLIFDVPALIAYVSTFTALAPGDVIATGTPSGVGWKRTPPIYLRAGDRVEVTVRGVGTLSNPVADEG